MSSKIFILAGTGRSGKDTFIKFIQEYSEEEVLSFSSIDYLKWVSKKFLDVDVDNKTPELRLFLSEFKRILTEYNDLPYKQCCTAIDSLDDNQHVFIQIREGEQIEKLKAQYPQALVVGVSRDDVVSHYGNKSDDESNKVNLDVEVFNNGNLTDLSNTAKWFCQRFILC